MVATRSSDFQLGLMLATAFAVLALPTAAEAYTPEGQQACTGDAFRLCSAEIPNVDRVRACLHRNKAQLSPGCRGFISPGHTGRRRAAAERQAGNCAKVSKRQDADGRALAPKKTRLVPPPRRWD
jgi:hypothetical protein